MLHLILRSFYKHPQSQTVLFYFSASLLATGLEHTVRNGIKLKQSKHLWGPW